MFVCFYHVAGFIVNANHGIMLPAVELCISECIGDSISIAIPQPTERENIGNQIKAAMIFSRSDFVRCLGNDWLNGSYSPSFLRAPLPFPQAVSRFG
jgi:hypothetical protein